jgi:iron complex outermembrane recepter protein
MNPRRSSLIFCWSFGMMTSLGSSMVLAQPSAPTGADADGPTESSDDDSPVSIPEEGATSQPASPDTSASSVSESLGIISGTVVSQDLDAPLAGATVSVVGTSVSVLTDNDGRFQLEVAPGDVIVRVEFSGFRTVDRVVTVGVGKEVSIDLPMPLSQALTEVIVVVGSRTPRTNVETPVAVDVVTSEEISRSGQSETGRVLNTLAPSFISKPQTVSDGTDHIDPASLRGLGPDQLLVLINGKRRHQSSLINLNGTFGRGSVGVDLNSIPAASIKRIEILRDGAASQYGSDAMSGVINIVLKDITDLVEVDTIAGVTGEGDGSRFSTAANYGFRLGEKGFINVTGEFIEREGTNRAGQYTGPVYLADRTADDAQIAARGLTRDDFRMKIGESSATVGMISYNLEYPLGNDATLYSFGGLTHRDGAAAGFFRYPTERPTSPSAPNPQTQNVPDLYPDGFLPEIHSDINDVSVGVGIRGRKAGWDVDLSLIHGTNSFQFNVEDSVNASLGSASPTVFDAGTLGFNQTVGNLDLLRNIETDVFKSLSFVLGTEFRVENFRIEAGDIASYQVGTSTVDGTPTGPRRLPGAQVFPGFRPEAEVDRSRNNIGAYVGIESQLTKRITFDVGGRFENYSDFGRSLIGKVAGRVELLKGVALRGAVSTGFRAPSLHQLWFSTIATNFIVNPATNALESAQVLTSNNASPVTRAFGIPDLNEERSINASGGITFRPIDNVAITADAYYIGIDDRIVLTSRFLSSNANVRDILSPFPAVTAAQFFANAIDTTTKGLDVVADYVLEIGAGSLTMTASANLTVTTVDEVHLPKSLEARFVANDDAEKTQAKQLRTFFFGRQEENRIESSLPRQKGTASVRYTLGPVSALARANYYGKVYLRPDNSANDERYGAKVVYDVDVGYQLTRNLRLTVGADNILNTFPDKNTKEANISAGRFVYSNLGQFGQNGGFYYGKLQLFFF